jgi:hypothetical protein
MGFAFRRNSKFSTIAFTTAAMAVSTPPLFLSGREFAPFLG